MTLFIKVDMIAVADMSFGAMENWGLIVYRDTRFLVDPSATSASVMESTASVIAHELTHQVL